MKTLFLITAGMAGLLMISSCAALMPPPWTDSQLEITKNEKGEITHSSYIRRVVGFSQDPETARSWAGADKVARSAQDGRAEATNTVSVIMENWSGYTFEVTTGEFKGLVLASGEKSNYTKEISIGAYTFRVKFIDDAGHLREWDVSRLITAKTDKIILRYGRR